MRRFPLLPPVLLLTFLAIAISNAKVAAADAGWTPVTNVNDPTIEEVGHFAVLIYSLSKEILLTFESVVSGQTQPASGGGVNYQLVVTAANGGGSSAQHNALVWGILGTQSWKLISFT